jgi:PAS domain S-box-containing protein
MSTDAPRPLEQLDEEAALRTFLVGTSAETGQRFFTSLVETLVSALQTAGAWVAEYMRDTRRLHALAFYLDGKWVDDYEFDIAHTPCETVIEQARLIHFPDRLIDLYPAASDVARLGMMSYLGMPLLDVDGTVLGHIAVVDRRPLPQPPRVAALFRIFADRAAAELRRIRAERQVREREEKCTLLVDSAMDAILQINPQKRVSRFNPAATKVFGRTAASDVETGLEDLLAPESVQKLRRLIDDLDQRPAGERSLWVPGGLLARRADGTTFPAEATLSRYEVAGEVFHSLILRDVNDRLAAEAKIRSLTDETEYLREELEQAGNFGDIIGQSPVLRRMLQELRQVAESDATVLILGETGTGKELVARAIHNAGRRRHKPLIKVNCAAIARELIESEFFGHEKGAFTGATARREGRFALADGGTIFLDEVGELPLDLQAKLLRVLQEGEFEPVGSSKTRKVDVRVIAATNCDLADDVRNGRFREDLYYRLNVFPLHVPPLRERGDDVLLLARAFVRKFAERMARRVEPLSTDDERCLCAYSWPGNVRELQNVIERAVITSRDGRLRLDSVLPRLQPDAGKPVSVPAAKQDDGRVYTCEEWQDLERQNILRALTAADWKVAGDSGAAARLGLKPSTLSSRIKALGISRPS